MKGGDDTYACKIKDCTFGVSTVLKMFDLEAITAGFTVKLFSHIT